MKLVDNFQHTFLPITFRVAATSPQDTHGLLHVDIVAAQSANEWGATNISRLCMPLMTTSCRIPSLVYMNADRLASSYLCEADADAKERPASDIC